MPCSNCYTGCTQTTSDKCVKYTGLPNTILGIDNGDSMNYVTASIMEFLTTAIDGTGIKYELAPEDMCTITSKHLEDCTDISVIAITKALSRGICELDTSVTSLQAFQAGLEADYNVPACVSVLPSAGTHDVLDATMEQVCLNTSGIDSINLNLITNYVAIEDIDQYIADYIENNTGGGETGYAANMVPYTVVEYYGSLTFFDATGAGIGEWANIYLCNGENNTPDKRGRVGVGTTSGMGGGSFPTETDPVVSGNPTYSLRTTRGSNTVTLTAQQMPSHTHNGTTSTDPGHTHGFEYPASVYDGGGDDDNRLSDTNNISSVDITATEPGGAHSHTFTTSAAGGGQSHSNIQPVLACHYIMYIPA